MSLNRIARPLPASAVKRTALTLFFSAALALPSFGIDQYLRPNHPDGIALLAPPPMPGSPDYKADLECARAVFKHRTPEAEAQAMKDAPLTIFNFTPAIGDFFQPGKFPKTEQFFKDIRPQVKAVIDAPKNHWQRHRPYEVDKSLTLGKAEPSFSYPSGHSTFGTLQSYLLAELFPEKRDAILQIGRNIGWDRVVIGKHFPTDVHAGRVLGQAIAEELLASPAFRRDFAELKAEIASVTNAEAHAVAKPAN